MKVLNVVEQYTQLKLALGSGFKNEPHHLKSFSERVGSIKINKVTAEQVQTFLVGRKPLTRTYYCRYAALNGLFKFAIAREYCSNSPMPKIRPKIHSKFTPYIYSRAELKKLLATTSEKGVCCQIEPNTFRVIILLLYGAMLRSSEAVSLKGCDVDLKEGLLVIHESKFYKTRFVPIGPKLTAILSRYFESRKNETSEYFFLRKRKTPLTGVLLRRHFIRLRNMANISRQDGYHPRLHDLRHTGAVHRVIDWYRNGKDVQKLIPRLSTYMGHAELKDTQVYLTLVPEIMNHASFKFEQYAFPEVSP
jgi:integrase/recombinase XerD